MLSLWDGSGLITIQASGPKIPPDSGLIGVDGRHLP